MTSAPVTPASTTSAPAAMTPSAASAAASPAIDAGRAPAPIGWWRRNALWLLGTAVLGAWAMIVPYREQLQVYRQRHPDQAIAAARGQWVAFEGARWRLVEAQALAPRDPRLRGPLRKDAGVLVATFEVIADSGTVAKDLDRCRGRVADAEGRLWDANPADLPRLGGDKLPETCGTGYGADFKPISALPGRPFAFRHAYVLPRKDRLDGLTLRIEFPNSPSSKGRYLSFAL